MVSAVLTLVLRLSAGAPKFTQVATWVEDTDELALLHIICQEVIKKRPSIKYADMDITPNFIKSGNDVLVLIENSVSVIFQITGSDKQNEVSAIINKFSSSSIQVPSAVNKFSNMMENYRAKMVMIKSSCCVGAVNNFHAEFDVAPKKEIFITMCLEKTSIHEQIEAMIVSKNGDTQLRLH